MAVFCAPQHRGAPLKYFYCHRVLAVSPLFQPNQRHSRREAETVTRGATEHTFPFAKICPFLPGKQGAVLLAHVSQVTEGQKARAQQCLIFTVLEKNRHQSWDSSKPQESLLLQVYKKVITLTSKNSNVSIKIYGARLYLGVLQLPIFISAPLKICNEVVSLLKGYSIKK